MNRYKQLFSTTFILGIGTFSSKLLVFLLMPLYTRVLTTGNYGVVDLLVQTANFLIPLVSLGINNAVMRFGMDGETDKRTVFSTGLFAVLGGYTVFLFCAPLFRLIPRMQGYTFWIYLFVLFSMLRSLCAQFVKSKHMVKMFAFNGVLGTAATVLFNILFLVIIPLGVLGYILAIICADLLSLLYLVFGARLWRYVRISALKKPGVSAMFRYALPLIPNTAFWWVTDLSDRYFVTSILGEAANGLYAVSYKIPTVMILLCGIFMDAWQISILSETSPLARQRFFGKVFSMYQTVAFVSAAGLIAFAKVITKILVSPAFYESWKYIPVLILATVFSCFVTFYGTIYVVEKKSGRTLPTTILGAVLNIIGNFLLIPPLGIQGAALSTCLSYAVVFLIRVIDTRKLIPLQWNIGRFLLNLVILILQSFVLIGEKPGWILWQSVLVAAMLLINYKTLVRSVKKVLGK